MLTINGKTLPANVFLDQESCMVAGSKTQGNGILHYCEPHTVIVRIPK
jgi:hypothetical protein